MALIIASGVDVRIGAAGTSGVATAIVLPIIVVAMVALFAMGTALAVNGTVATDLSFFLIVMANLAAHNTMPS